MRISPRLLPLLLAAFVLSPGLSASQQKPSRPAPKPVAPATRPAPAAPTTTKDPFIGVWKLSAEKSKYESSAPRGLTRTYEDRGGGTIFMTTDVMTSQGAAHSYLVYKRDGKQYPEAAVGADSVRFVTVTAIDPRTEEMYSIADGKRSEKPITTSISADGMTMTQVVSGRTSKGQAFTNTAVFDKQP